MLPSKPMLTHARPGKGCLWAIVMLAVLALMIFMGDMAYIYLGEECMGMDPLTCASHIASMENEDEAPAEGTVTAVGSAGDDKGSLTFSLTIPLEGGAVTGSFEGDCDGTLKASFAGGNGGAITGGKGMGKCAFVLPASGNFTGTVNTATKTVVITGKGSIPGGSKEGSVTLKW